MAVGKKGGHAKAPVAAPRQGEVAKNAPDPKGATYYGKQPGGTRGSNKGAR